MMQSSSQATAQSSTRRCLRAIALLLLCGFIPARAQEDRHPQRGFHPGNTYSVSEIETISMANGNLGLSIPLGSLPAGRGGTPGFTLGLTYNSKSYDSHVETLHNALGQPENVTHLNFSEDGGWRYTRGGYERRALNRFNEEPAVPCEGWVEPFEYQRNSFIWKMQVIYPDGSAHEFRPVGFNDQFDDGFFNISPNGWLFQDGLSTVGGGLGCTHSETLVTTAPMVYYSTDGSYTRLVVEHNSNPADHSGWSNQWTLFFPDGGRVTNQPNEPQRVYDRNNRFMTLVSTVHNNHPATKIIDELGRFIMIEIDSQSDPSTGAITRQDHIYVKGTGGVEMQWTVDWKQIYIYKPYRATVETGGFGRGNTYQATWEGVLLVVDQITLPSQAGGLTYKFGYNAGDYVGDTQQPSFGWGELSSVTLPSGARASYTFGLEGGTIAPMWKSVLKNRPKRKELRYRQEFDLAPINNTPCDPQVEACTTDVWTYGGIGQASLMTPHTTSVTGPDGGITTETIEDNPNNPFTGRTLVTILPDGTKVENLWQQNRAPGMIGGKVNPFIKTVATSIKNAAGNYVLTAIKDYDYDKNGNVTRVAEYDWVPYSGLPPTGPPEGVSPKRVTVNTYYSTTPDALNTTSDDPDIYHHVSAPQLLSSAQSAEVGDGGTQPLTRSELFYDNPNTTGNLTEQRTWDSQKGPYSNPLSAANSISVTNEYDPQVLGKLTQTTDPRGFRTEYTYGPVNGFTDLYPTETRIAAGTSVQRRITAEYDFDTGLVTRSTDADNGVSTVTSHDVLGRTILVRAAEGRPEETQTSTQYIDSERRVVVRSDLDLTGDGKLASIQHYDQIGRVRLTRRLEGFSTPALADESIGIKVQTRYLINNPCQPINDPQCLSANDAALASYVLTSNPYRAATSGAAASESTMGWTRSRSDKTGRAVELQTLAGSNLPGPWGGNTSGTGTVTKAFDGVFTTVIDQAGKIARNKADAFGSLVRVDEPSDGNHTLGPQDTPTQATSYEYDALGNLTSATQGVQIRTFNYTSLSRLKDAMNPENGTISYVYDENGNLKVKIDPRLLPTSATHISTTYDYDALNRLKSRTYNDGTPNVTYTYDAPEVLNSKGRLTIVSSSVSAYSYGEYDALGRVLTGTQTTGGGDYTTQYSYNRVSAVISQTYPSGRVVKTEYDPAGRIAGVKNNGTGAYYAGSFAADATNRFQYSSVGAVQAVKLGNGLWEHTNFNSRSQVTQIGLGTSISDSSKLKLDYTVGVLVGGVLDPTKNNGNVQSQTITLPGTTAIVQNYDYDELNRLKTAQEIGASGWTEQFSHDRFGNRTGITIADNPSSRLPSLAPEVNSATNRFKLVNSQNQTTGYDYDVAGNLTQEPETGSTVKKYSYDAENHVTQAKRINGSIESDISTYRYDSGGRRVKTIVGSISTVYVYNVSGQMIAEYTDAATTTSGIGYITSDTLGNSRVVTGSAAEVRERHDYLPFGEEVPSVYGNRVNVSGYDSDNLRQKFTSKERDIETGLDYFLARYYSSTHGRFTSVDPSGVSIHPTNPQSLNRYTYALNNPLTYVDENGKWPTGIHNLIIDRALPGLSKADRKAIKDGSWFVDDPVNGGQHMRQANQHGQTMSSPEQSQDDAAVKADTFINNRVDQAQDCLKQGSIGMSLWYFGMAFHTVSDMTSPAHEGYQVWQKRGVFLHRDTERLISSFRMGLAVGATIRLYQYTYGQTAMQRAVGYTPGSQNDPTVQAIQSQFSLPGSDPRAEAESLYEYRLGLQEGLNFDWGRQHGRRSRRQSERPIAN